MEKFNKQITIHSEFFSKISEGESCFKCFSENVIVINGIYSAFAHILKPTNENWYFCKNCNSIRKEKCLN